MAGMEAPDDMSFQMGLIRKGKILDNHPLTYLSPVSDKATPKAKWLQSPFSRYNFFQTGYRNTEISEYSAQYSSATEEFLPAEALP